MNPNASSTLGTRSPRGFVPRVVFCVGAYGLDSSILLGSTLSTNDYRHPVAASNVPKSQGTRPATWVHDFVQVSRWRGSSVIDGSALALPMFYTIPSLFPTS
jgi:hypothetical protein